MTPKEMLGVLSHLILDTPLDKQNIDELKLKAEVYIPEIEEALNELEELKRVPTAEEVCEAIQDHLTLKNKVIYDEKDKSFCLEYGTPPIYSIPLIEVKEGYITHCLPFTTPKMLILVGKFYEGKVKNDVSSE